MKKIFMLLSCLSVLTIATSNVMAHGEAKIKNIKVEKEENTVKVIFETEGEPKIIAYDIVQPPQIIIDIIGNGITNVDENIPVHYGAIEQIKVMKTDGNDEEGYYGIDFWVVELNSPLEYKFSSQDGAYILTLAKSKTIDAAKSAENILLPGIPIEETPISVAEDPKQLAGKLRQQGYQYQMEGNYDKAVECYQKAIEKDPSCATAYNDLGVMYYLYLNEADKAIETLKKALSINPNYIGAHTNLALIYEQTGNKEEALKHWTERARLGQPEDYWTKTAKEKIEALGKE